MIILSIDLKNKPGLFFCDIILLGELMNVIYQKLDSNKLYIEEEGTSSKHIVTMFVLSNITEFQGNSFYNENYWLVREIHVFINGENKLEKKMFLVAYYYDLDGNYVPKILDKSNDELIYNLENKIKKINLDCHFRENSDINNIIVKKKVKNIFEDKKY